MTYSEMMEVLMFVRTGNTGAMVANIVERAVELEKSYPSLRSRKDASELAYWLEKLSK